MCIFHSRDMVPISHHSSQWEFQFPIYTSSEIELFEKKCGKLETWNIEEDKRILGEGRPLIIAGKLYENPVYVNSEEYRFISLFRQNNLYPVSLSFILLTLFIFFEGKIHLFCLVSLLLYNGCILPHGRAATTAFIIESFNLFQNILMQLH